MDTARMLPYACCDAARFADHAHTRAAGEIWRFLAGNETVALMADSSRRGRPAIEPLIEALKERLEPLAAEEGIDTQRFKSMCLNMCRQIMEHHGYRHVACALMPGGYFGSAGLFSKEQS